jgi:hypothetical protein
MIPNALPSVVKAKNRATVGPLNPFDPPEVDPTAEAQGIEEVMSFVRNLRVKSMSGMLVPRT